MSAQTALPMTGDLLAPTAFATYGTDLDNPLEAITSYSRSIHAHTKIQMEQSLRRSSSSSSSSSDPSTESSSRTSPPPSTAAAATATSSTEASSPSTGAAPPAPLATAGSTNPRRTGQPTVAEPVSSMAQLGQGTSTESSDESQGY